MGARTGRRRGRELKTFEIHMMLTVGLKIQKRNLESDVI
jgi:hypothetical protein